MSAIRETSVLFDWDQHHVFGPYEVRVKKRSHDLSAGGLPSRPASRSPQCGVFGFQRGGTPPSSTAAGHQQQGPSGSACRMLVHWYIERSGGRSALNSPESRDLDGRQAEPTITPRGQAEGARDLPQGPFLTFVFPGFAPSAPTSARAGGPGGSLQQPALADRPATRIIFDFSEQGDIHLISCSADRNAPPDTFDFVVLTADAHLVSVRFRIPLSCKSAGTTMYPVLSSNGFSESEPGHENAVHFAVCSTPIEDLLEANQVPVQVASWRNISFILTNADVVRPVFIQSDWDMAGIKGSWRGSIRCQVHSLGSTFSSWARFFSRVESTLDIQTFSMGECLILATLTDRQVVFHNAQTLRWMGCIDPLPNGTTHVRVHPSAGRLILRAERDLEDRAEYPSFHIYDVQLTNGGSLTASKCLVLDCKGLPDDIAEVKGQSAAPQQFVDLALFDSESLVVAYAGVMSYQLFSRHIADGSGAWVPMNGMSVGLVSSDSSGGSPRQDSQYGSMVGLPATPHFLIDKALRKFCLEFRVPLDPTSELTFDAVVDEYMRGTDTGGLFDSAYSQSDSKVATSARHPSHVELYVAKIVGAYHQVSHFIRLDLDIPESPTSTGPLLVLKRAGYSLIRSKLVTERVADQLVRSQESGWSVNGPLSEPLCDLWRSASRIFTVPEGSSTSELVKGLDVDSWIQSGTMTGPECLQLIDMRIKELDQLEKVKMLHKIKQVKDNDDQREAVLDDLRRLIQLLTFTSTISQEDVAVARVRLFMPHLVCPLLLQVLSDSRFLAKVVFLITVTFSQLVRKASSPSRALSLLRGLSVLPHIISPEVLPLLPLQMEIPATTNDLALAEDGMMHDDDRAQNHQEFDHEIENNPMAAWLMSQLATVASSHSKWTYAEYATFLAAAPRSAARALIGASSAALEDEQLSRARARHLFLRGLWDIIQSHGRGNRAAEGVKTLKEAVYVDSQIQHLEKAAYGAATAPENDLLAHVSAILERNGLYAQAAIFLQDQVLQLSSKLEMKNEAAMDDGTGGKQRVVHTSVLRRALGSLVYCHVRSENIPGALDALQRLVALPRDSDEQESDLRGLVVKFVNIMAEPDVTLPMGGVLEYVEQALLSLIEHQANEMAQAAARLAAVTERNAAARHAAEDHQGGRPRTTAILARARSAAAHQLLQRREPFERDLLALPQQVHLGTRWLELLGSLYVHQCSDFAEAAKCFYAEAVLAQAYLAPPAAQAQAMTALLKALNCLHMITEPDERFLLLRGAHVENSNLYKYELVPLSEIQREYDELTLQAHVDLALRNYTKVDAPPRAVLSTAATLPVVQFGGGSFALARPPRDPLRLPKLIAQLARSDDGALAREYLARYAAEIRAETKRDSEWLDAAV